MTKNELKKKMLKLAEQIEGLRDEADAEIARLDCEDKEEAGAEMQILSDALDNIVNELNEVVSSN